MSECDEVLKLLSDYIDGELDPAASRDLDRHFQDCPECLTFLHSLRQTIAITRTITFAEIPKAVRDRLHAFLRERLGRS